MISDIKRAHINRYKELTDNLVFLFDFSKSLEENEINWTRYEESINHKTLLWCLLTNASTSEIQESKVNADDSESKLKESIDISPKKGLGETKKQRHRR